MDEKVSSIEGYFSPNVQYAPWYIANYRKLFSPMGDLPILSNFTSGLNYGAIDFTSSILNGLALILSGYRDVDQIGVLNRMTPWQGMILLPLCGLAMYCHFVPQFSRRISPWHIVIIFAFTAFPNYPFVIWSLTGGSIVPVGWFVFLSVYLFILARNFKDGLFSQWTILAIVSILFVQPTYHTVALTLTFMLFLLWVLQYWFKKEYISATSITISIVAFASFLMYYAFPTLRSYGHLFSQFLGDFYRSFDKGRLEYSLGILDTPLVWYILNYLAVLSPVIWTSILFYKKNNLNRKESDFLTYQWIWLLSLIPLSIAFFAWGGVFGVYERLLQYGTLLAIASTAFLLASRPKSGLILAVAALLCVFITTFLTRNLNAVSSNYITKDEEQAIHWIVDNKLCNEVVFTDFRIGTTFGYWGCFSVVGPNASNLSARGQSQILSALLYDGDRVALHDALETLSTLEGKTPHVLLLSHQFLDSKVGFSLPDTRLKAITENQWSAFVGLENWHIVFVNDSTLVMKRND